MEGSAWAYRTMLRKVFPVWCQILPHVVHGQDMEPRDWEECQDPGDLEQEHEALLPWEEDEGLEEERPINAGDGFEDWGALTQGEGEDAENEWPEEEEEETDGCLAHAGEELWPEDEEWDQPAEEGWEEDRVLAEDSGITCMSWWNCIFRSCGVSMWTASTLAGAVDSSCAQRGVFEALRLQFAW